MGTTRQDRAYLAHWFYLLAACFVIVAITTGKLRAQTLSEAFVSAYRNNPGLQSQRFQARSVDETVPEALSGYKPKISGDAFYGRTSRDEMASPSGRPDGETYGYSAQIEQQLFDGFRTRNGVSEAQSEVHAAHQNLQARQSEILFQAATSYFDVLRDEGILLYRRRNLTALRRELVGARERLGRGHATLTDLEQTRQRAALARSDLEQAAARLRVSQIRFARITGLPARNLRMPAEPKALWPKSLRRAVEAAEGGSPIIRAAHAKYNAAQYAIAKVRGELLPDVKLVGRYDRSFNTSSSLRDDSSASIVGRLHVPLYQGGAVSARTRRAHNDAMSRNRDLQDAKLRVGEAVGAAWTELNAARKRQALEGKAVSAGERALEAVRDEQRAGRRTVLDVLDAERELVNARIRLLNTRRDLHVNTYALLRSTGELRISKLVPDAEQYDPKQHYRAVRSKWWGITSPTAGGDGFLGEDHRVKPELTQSNTSQSKVSQAVRGWQTKVKGRRR